MNTIKKFDMPFVSFIPHEHLRHHIIMDNHTEEKINTIEREYAAKDRLGKYNLEPKKKILLLGKKGYGKTLCAERIAWNLGLPLLKVNFNAILSCGGFNKFLPVIFDIFDYVEKESIVLLLKNISDGPHITTLLVLLEEYQTKGLIIASSNTKNWDDFFIKHFDEVVFFSLIRKKERMKILEMALSSVDHDEDIDFLDLADQLPGYSCADIIKIVQQTIKNCILSGNKKIKKAHIQCVINDVKFKFN